MNKRRTREALTRLPVCGDAPRRCRHICDEGSLPELCNLQRRENIEFLDPQRRNLSRGGGFRELRQQAGHLRVFVGLAIQVDGGDFFLFFEEVSGILAEKPLRIRSTKKKKSSVFKKMNSIDKMQNIS